MGWRGDAGTDEGAPRKSIEGGEGEAEEGRNVIAHDAAEDVVATLDAQHQDGVQLAALRPPRTPSTWCSASSPPRLVLCSVHPSQALSPTPSALTTGQRHSADCHTRWLSLCTPLPPRTRDTHTNARNKQSVGMPRMCRIRGIPGWRSTTRRQGRTSPFQQEEQTAQSAQYPRPMEHAHRMEQAAPAPNIHKGESTKL